MAQDITTVKINELATSAINSSDYFVKADQNGIAYKNTLSALANFMGSVGVLGYQGALAIADTPTEDGFYFASETGTYTNAGGLVVDLAAGINIISVTGTQTVFELVVIPVDLSSQLVNTVDPEDTTKGVTGLAVDTFAKSDIKGFNVNRGVKFPTYGIETQQPTTPQDGSITGTNARFVYNVMLDFKVVNAKKDHVYHVDFMGNNHATYGDGIIIKERLTDGTNVRDVINNINDSFVAPIDKNKPGTFSLESDDGIIFLITADYSTEDGRRYISNVEGTAFYNDYIDPSRYVYEKNIDKEKTLVLQRNTFMTVPEGVKITSKYDSVSDFQLEFGRYGYNENYGIDSARITENNKSYPAAEEGAVVKQFFDNTSTDWVGPYVVEAINNPTNTYDPTFTGANHNFREEGETPQTGAPTQVVRRITVTADGQPYNSNDVRYADEVNIKVETSLAAYNTMAIDGLEGYGGSGRIVMIEIITYRITAAPGGGMSVEVGYKSTPTEDVNIHTYYGIQSSLSNAWNGSVDYARGTNLERINMDGNGNPIGNDAGNKVSNAAIYRSPDNVHDLVMWFDESTGIGDMVENDMPYSFFYVSGNSNTQKGYLNLIGNRDFNSQHLALTSSDSIFWRGGYIFTKNNTSPGLDSGYVSKRGNKMIAEMNYLGAGVGALSVPLSLNLSELEIIQNDPTVTIDPLVNSALVSTNTSGKANIKVELK